MQLRTAVKFYGDCVWRQRCEGGQFVGDIGRKRLIFGNILPKYIMIQGSIGITIRMWRMKR